MQGYPDGSFKPEQGVNRAEALKMVLGLANVNPEQVESAPYADVKANDWFAPYVEYAKNKNLMHISGSKFSPSAEMSRQEVAELIYRLSIVRENNGKAYSVLD